MKRERDSPDWQRQILIFLGRLVHLFLSLCKKKSSPLVPVMYISFAYRAGKWDLITRNHSRCMSKCELTSCPQRCMVEPGINSLTVRIQMFHRGDEHIWSRSACISVNRDSSLQFSSYKWLRNCRIVKQLLSAWPKKVLTSCGHSYSHTPHEHSLSLSAVSLHHNFLKWIDGV